MIYIITITTSTGKIINEEYGTESRCNNCGKPFSKAKACITGGLIADNEWACCKECQLEMELKGCCFEELGENIYRPQKY